MICQIGMFIHRFPKDIKLRFNTRSLHRCQEMAELQIEAVECGLISH